MMSDIEVNNELAKEMQEQIRLHRINSDLVEQLVQKDYLIKSLLKDLKTKEDVPRNFDLQKLTT